jgi:hypothetical protein
MQGLRSIFVITFFVTAGCGLPTLDLRDQLDLHRISFHEKLIAKETLAKAFLACTRQAHDEPMTGSDSVSTDANHSSGLIFRPIGALVERVKAHRRKQTEPLLALQELFANDELLHRRRLDLGKLRRVADLIRQWHAHIDFDEDDLAQDGSRFGQLLLAYNKAYFGDVQFVPEPPPSGGGVRGVLKVTSSGFIDRNGTVWAFPGLSVDVQKELEGRAAASASSVDSQRVSADLTRVFLEAFFDDAFRVPAVHGATALQIERKSSAPRYPEFDADHPLIPLDALARVTRDALRAEAAVTSLVGKEVRGGSVFSIQNETLAATLETAAGVIAKKLVEHEGFCYYQVTVGQPSIAAHDQNEQGHAPVATRSVSTP